MRHNEILVKGNQPTNQPTKQTKQQQGQDVTCHVHVSDKVRLFGIRTDSNEVHICTSEIYTRYIVDDESEMMCI